MDDRAIWLIGGMAALPKLGRAPLLWQTRLDDPAVAALACRASLDAADLRDLARLPQSAMRATRRKLTKFLLSGLAGLHPQQVLLDRSETGAIKVATPAGWHVSLAGQWPFCLIGVSHRPLGVDIEPRDVAAPPDSAFTSREYAELSNASDSERLKRWLMKEAHAKLYGNAAQVAPDSIETFMDGDRATARSTSGWSEIAFHHGDQVVCAVAQEIY